ncbi:MAG: TIGR02302 family protein [Pseudomonadota bacterium]
MTADEQQNPVDTTTTSPVKDPARAILCRKVAWSKQALYFERLWPRIWPLLGVAAAFFLASLLGIWPNLGQTAHLALLSLFGIAALASVIFILMTPWPSQDEAIRRIEQKSGVPHRPATSYEDTLSSSSTDPTTKAVWSAHRKRLAETLGGLKVGSPQPDTARRDPLALRALVILAVTLGIGFLGERASDRVAEAFEFRTAKLLANARVDAWVAPPAYTRKPPIMLADGGRPQDLIAVSDTAKLVDVPEGSILIARATGVTRDDVQLEILNAGKDPILIGAADPDGPLVQNPGVIEIRHKLMQDARVRLLISNAEAARWTFAVDPDTPPTIALTKDPEITRRGSMKLTYKIKDDYGVSDARAKVQRSESDEQDPATAWARENILTGPRPPLERPPRLTLRVPRGEQTDGEAVTHLEIGTHPWSGLNVEMTLVATDVAGKTGQGKTLKLKLPERQFTKPLARAIVEQRRKLVEDPRYRPQVIKALDALTLEPEGFIDDVQVYLGLRTVFYRLQREPTRARRNSIIEQLWHIALRIEDGDLSDAERRLREAQDKLSKLLEDGATEAEIEEAMKELRQAMNDYMQQLQKQAQENPMQPQNGQDPNSQFMSQSDLDRMMKELEDMAKSGAREQAQQMLSEMRDLLDRMQQSQQANQQQSEQSRQMQQAMKDLGDLVGQQQKLMDDTFGEQRQQGQQGQQGQRGQQGQPGQQQRGSQRRGPQGQPGQQGQAGQQGQQGQPGQQGQRGQSGQQQDAQGLRDRQNALRQKLEELQRNMGQQGNPSPEQLANAQRAMENAEQALRDGDLPTATREQARALDEMRQGAEQMAQQMQQNSPQRYGQNGDAPRDPLGRPQRSEGPDQGTSVKVPDQIDIQRAREILRELRNRLGDPLRPSQELEYIERLLRRF